MLPECKKFIKIFQQEVDANIKLNELTVSAYIYGSMVTGEINEQSDIDCIVVAKTIDYEYAQEINRLRTKLCQELGRKIFINVMKAEDLDTRIIANNTFVHRERPYLFLFDLLHHFKIIYGKDIVSNISLPSSYDHDLRAECVRLVRNIRYMNYKLLSNEGNEIYAPETIFKNFLFASKIYSIFSRNQYEDYETSVKYLTEKLNSSTALNAYNLLKKEKGENEELGKQVKKDSIVFYDSLLEKMEAELEPAKTRKGCIVNENFVVYYEFSEDIVSKRSKAPAIVFLNGMPRPSGIEKIATHFVDAGYIFFNVYYPGYWEGRDTLKFSELPEKVSELGKFLKEGQAKDIINGGELPFSASELYLIGSSFGGTVSLTVADGIFEKIIAVSPLVDFSKHQAIIDDLFVKLDFFSPVIRLSYDAEEAKSDFDLLDPASREFLPLAKNTLIIADKYDPQIHFEQVCDYAEKNEIELYATDNSVHGYRLLNFNKIKDKIKSYIQK